MKDSRILARLRTMALRGGPNARFWVAKKKSLGLRRRVKRSAGDISEPRLLNGYICTLV